MAAKVGRQRFAGANNQIETTVFSQRKSVKLKLSEF